MAQNKTAPGWGKAVGILMIVFGALGVFIQIYKIMIPQILRMQNQMMNSFSQLETYEQPNPFRTSGLALNEIMGLSELQANVLLYSGLLGFIACAVYIVGGAKLLSPKPANYNFAKYSLIGFLLLNAITTGLLTTSGPSIMVMGLLVYVILGLVIDVVLLIVLLSNNKTQYGIGHSDSDEVDTVYRQEEVL
ncbi:MAG: hypothetical protein HYZ14_09425 [Bacteroidetes bacterium]|nr:hypothetical protein [Bacteroidota bacterium]